MSWYAINPIEVAIGFQRISEILIFIVKNILQFKVDESIPVMVNLGLFKDS
jgi:hypothetical protein